MPSSRIARLSKFGGLAARIAGNMLVDGVKQVSRGEKLNRQDLLLTPNNVEQFANKLANLRGAAMKLGQMISMDAGELLSPELSALLARLRADAEPMPHKQLVHLLKTSWGEHWLDSFSHFDLRPFAAASIGQVHKATLANGQALAVKVQYPGVRQSIESDVDNVARLLKMSRLIPPHIDITALLEATKQQLQNEADYQLEATHVETFQRHLLDTPFNTPYVHRSLSNTDILVMDYVDGIAIEQTTTLPQLERDRIVSDLLDLMLKELFSFKLMQTDPNFANYVYDKNSKRIGLLDFGATRKIPSHTSSGYLALIKAGIDQDSESAVIAAKQIGFFDDTIQPEYLNEVMNIFDLACEPLRRDEDYDFASSNLATRVRDVALNIKNFQSEWHTPPVDALFIHRKIGGLYLLASNLKAKVNVRQLIQPYL